MTSHTPCRIVSLQPSATVIIDCLGLLDRVVACTRYCADVCPDAATGRIIVADSWTAQSAEILAAKPDLVIASVPYQEKAVIEILKAGVRFLGFAPRTLVDIYGDIGAIAGILGAPERGAEVIARMQADISAIASQASGTRLRVYCEEWGKPLIHSQPWVAELVQAAGGEFIGAPGKQTTPQQVAEAQPDVIVAAWCGAGDRVPLEKIVRERHWQELPAVRHGRVFCIRDELLNTPAPTLVGGLRALAHAINPRLFSNADGIRPLATNY
ncbi:MAG TPA: ABC transporter substrate-binding protein [Terriglobales bacterium]|nr:ABC transporter substrate-binding protein [Terriglobales bacterium]